MRCGHCDWLYVGHATIKLLRVEQQICAQSLLPSSTLSTQETELLALIGTGDTWLKLSGQTAAVPATYILLLTTPAYSAGNAQQHREKILRRKG